MTTNPDPPADDARLLGEEAMRLLRRLDVCSVGPGLTASEFDRIERDYGFRFAADHRAFLAGGLPTNDTPEPEELGMRANQRPWPDWRNGDPDELRKILRRPVDCVLFYVKHRYWHETWGQRPDDLESRIALAERMLARAPAMVPVYGHRYVPAGRETYAHPVLSIVQDDIIYYGMNLADYIRREFAGSSRLAPMTESPDAFADFWRDFLG